MSWLLQNVTLTGRVESSPGTQVTLLFVQVILAHSEDEI